MRSHCLIAALAAALFAGSAGGAAAAELNKPPEGFTALFNGNDLTNWQGLVDVKYRAQHTPEEVLNAQAEANQKMLAHWTVKDGVLMYDGKGDSLQTARDYGNFEMWVDWKIEKGGDSGIYLRGQPQVQIWEASDKPALDKNGNFVGSGGLYNDHPPHPSNPLVVADNPAGEWNTFWIRMVGDKVTVKLNGKLVVDNVPLDNYFFPGMPLAAKGPLELQHHGSHLEFRNIYLKELPGDAADARPNLLNLELNQVPLSQVIQALAASGGIEISLRDPDGKLSSLPISLTIHQRTVEKAILLLCSAGGLQCQRDASGVYLLAAKQ